MTTMAFLVFMFNMKILSCLKENEPHKLQFAPKARHQVLNVLINKVISQLITRIISRFTN